MHYDITQWNDKKYKSDDLFKIGVTNLNGKKLVDIAKEQKIEKILSCGGGISLADNTNQSLENLLKELGTVISKSEGTYEAWNAGAPSGKKVQHGKMKDASGTITGKTINQLLALSTEYPWTDSRRRFATGKYQTIPTTLASAKIALKLSGNELYDANMQERVFREFLARKQKEMKALIDNGNVSVDEAMVGAAREWASIALPKGYANKFGVVSDGTISYYQSATNKAHVKTSAEVRAILEKIKKFHNK